MTSKAAIVRENITLDEESMQWTCNQCFQDRLNKPDMEGKPLKAYSYSCTSNIARHFEEFHREMFTAALMNIDTRRREALAAKKQGKGHVTPKKPFKRPRLHSVKRESVQEVDMLSIHHQDYDWAENDCTEVEEENAPMPVASNSSISVSPAAGSEDEALKMFFDAMYASVRKMSNHHKLHIRKKMFEMVTEIEEQELTEYRVEDVHEETV